MVPLFIAITYVIKAIYSIYIYIYLYVDHKHYKTSKRRQMKNMLKSLEAQLAWTPDSLRYIRLRSIIYIST